jgi:hypothetical protein
MSKTTGESRQFIVLIAQHPHIDWAARTWRSQVSRLELVSSRIGIIGLSGRH